MTIILYPSTIKFIWQMFKEGEKGIKCKQSHSRSVQWIIVQNSVKNRVLLHTGLVLNSLYSTVDLFIPYACSFFDLFNTDDHIDRVYKELKEVCFIFIIMYIKIVYCTYLCLYNLGFE